MPRVTEGLLKAIAATVVAITLSYAVLVTITSVVNVIDRIDAMSMEMTGLPARSTSISSGAEAVAQQAVVLAVLVPIGVIVVYFLHRPRR